jgi:hypothetical protein
MSHGFVTPDVTFGFLPWSSVPPVRRAVQVGFLTEIAGCVLLLFSHAR